MAGQLWSTNSLGGYFYSLNLSNELRRAVQPMTKFRQFADVKDASQQGKSKGETFTWDVVKDVGRQGRTLTETNTMAESNFTITQGTLTITEAGQAVPYSGKLEALSKFDVKAPVMKALKNDAAKWFDIAAHAEFNSTPLRVVGTSSTAIALTTNGTATATNSIAFNNTHHKAIIDVMKERNIPAYANDDYMAIAWPSTLRTLKNNLESIHQYTTEGFGMIATGEIGQLLHEVRPVVRDRVGGVMAEPFDGFYREAALAQALEQHTVGAGGKAVGMGKHDQGHVVNPFGSGVLEKQQLLRWGGLH